MAIDPWIAAQPTYSAPTIGAMAQGANQVQQVQQQQLDLQSQNALRQLFAQPDTVDDNGMLSKNALKQIYAISPQAGAIAQQNQFKIQQQQMQEKMLSSKMFQNQMDMSYQVNTDARLAHDRALAGGQSEEAAMNAGQQTLSDGIETMKNSGMFTPDQVAKFKTKFDPNNGAIIQDQYEKYQTWLSNQKQRQVANKRDDDKLEVERMRALEQERHNKELEAARTPNPQGLALKKFMEEHPNATSDEIASFNRDVKKDPEGVISDDVATKMAQQYLTGDTSVMQNIGRGAQAADNIAKVRRAIYTEADKQNMSPQQIASKVAEFGGLKAGERTLGTRTAQIGMAVSEAQKVAPLALEASEKVNRTNYPTLNSVLLAAEKGTGGEDVARFSVATNSLINIYSRAISPTGVGTVSDKDHAREILSSAYSKGQYSAAIDQMMKEMNAAAQAPGAVREEFRNAVSGGKEISDAAGQVKPSEGSPSSGLPEAAAKQLQKGHITVFNNGEKWTIGPDGQPKKVM